MSYARIAKVERVVRVVAIVVGGAVTCFFALLAGVMPMNEYKAQGISGIDCDSSAVFVMFGLISLVSALVSAGVIVALDPKEPPPRKRAVRALLTVFLLCLPVAVAAVVQYDDYQLETKTCEESGKMD